jgi:prepilin-type N-terminal cleavage/methylation domain-containing protein
VAFKHFLLSHFSKKRRTILRSGFTLVELLIVMAIVIMLMASAVSSMANSRKYFTFTNAYEKAVQMVREVRSNAVTGKAEQDYTDYDQDGVTIGDLVTPAGYGINFDSASGTITMFADLHKSDADPNQHEGIYDAPTSGAVADYQAGKDLILEIYTIDPALTLVLAGGPSTIIYTPVFADIIFNPGISSGNFFIFGVSEGADLRHKCSKIHPVAGIPEIATDAECPST